jgi:hypothetical protein
MKPEQNPKEKAFYECIRPHVENVVANDVGLIFESLLASGELYDHIIEQIMHDLCLAARLTDMSPDCEALVPIINSNAFNNWISEEVDEMLNATTTRIKRNYGAFLEHPDYVHRKGGGD